MTTVAQMLKQKNRTICSIGPDATVLDAITKMAEEDVGAILVMERDSLKGIFTERQYTRKATFADQNFSSTPVRNVMERKVMYVQPDQSNEECLALMIAKRIRHLPVLDGGKVVGIISIGDLGKSILADKEFTIDQLEHYMYG